MLFFPVYTEAHPLRNVAFASRRNLLGAAQTASHISSAFSNSSLPRVKGRGAYLLTKAKISLNSFEIKRFRTLDPHLKATVFSNSLRISRFRTLCKIPGIGYPPPSILFSTLSRRSRFRSARIARFLATSGKTGACHTLAPPRSRRRADASTCRQSPSNAENFSRALRRKEVPLSLSADGAGAAGARRGGAGACGSAA
jgi:hypothetical protein